MTAKHKVKFKSFAVAHSDVPTAVSVASGFSGLLQANPPQLYSTPWCSAPSGGL